MLRTVNTGVDLVPFYARFVKCDQQWSIALWAPKLDSLVDVITQLGSHRTRPIVNNCCHDRTHILTRLASQRLTESAARDTQAHFELCPTIGVFRLSTVVAPTQVETRVALL